MVVVVAVAVVGFAGFEAGGRPAAVSGGGNRPGPKAEQEWRPSVWLLLLEINTFPF